jgi:cellulose biosynthesis protein BcsQ
MKIVVYNNKGGVGKSTLVCHTAFRAAEQNISLNVIDADQQCNSMAWLSGHQWNGDEAFNRGSVSVTTNINSAQFHNVTLIDASPAFNFVQNVSDVDIFIIPVSGRFSVDGAINVISQVNQKSPGSRLVLVANMSEANTNFGQSELEQIKKLGIALFKFPIARHDVVRRAEMLGQAAWQVPYGTRTLTAQNLQIFSDWILSGFDTPTAKARGILGLPS